MSRAVPQPCQDPGRCGHPQDGPGHPRKGWIKVHEVFNANDPWFCSWTCLVRHASLAAVRAGQVQIA